MGPTFPVGPFPFWVPGLFDASALIICGALPGHRKLAALEIHPAVKMTWFTDWTVRHLTPEAGSSFRKGDSAKKDVFVGAPCQSEKQHLLVAAQQKHVTGVSSMNLIRTLGV